jgi:mannosyl-oligosaccharide alpha-1,2-mannosidase
MMNKAMKRKLRRDGRYILLLPFLVIVAWTFHAQVEPVRSSFPVPRVQHNFGSNDTDLAQTSRQRAVRQEFLHAWSGYHRVWMSDSLRPLSGTAENQFCGWSATLIDSLDTLWIIGLDDEFQEALKATLTVSFDNRDKRCVVNLFEMTIRHLGGLIAAYDLSHDDRLLSKIDEMGELLHAAFHTENGMPCSHCALVSQPLQEFRSSSHIAMAAQGTLSLEFIRLAQITKKGKYLESAMRLTAAFARTQNDSTIPGLWPEIIDASSMDGTDPQFSKTNFAYGIGALSDSTYEYLVKSHQLFGHQTGVYRTMWRAAADAIRKYILFRAQLPEHGGRNILFSGIAIRYAGENDTTFKPHIEHLSCFAGGMFGLASRIFQEPDDFAIGEALTNGCVWAYEAGPLGIMPKAFTVLPCPVQDGTQCHFKGGAWEESSARNDGMVYSIGEKLPVGMESVIDARYLLRPEAIESVFYYWRMTGEEYWREVGWKMFTAIRRHTKCPYAHASLENVMRVVSPNEYGGQAGQRDEMESFWFGETLKYFYLLFSAPSLISLDEYVLNTEAHPFKIGNMVSAR